MLEKKELTFVIFILHALGQHWNMTTPEVYDILNSTGILDDYIILLIYNRVVDKMKVVYPFYESVIIKKPKKVNV